MSESLILKKLSDFKKRLTRKCCLNRVTIWHKTKQKKNILIINVPSRCSKMKKGYPSDWTSAIIRPLHKKGNKSDINNCRGIYPLSVTYKTLSKALLLRVSLNEAGFRKARSCTKQIPNLETILNYRKLLRHPT